MVLKDIVDAVNVHTGAGDDLNNLRAQASGDHTDIFILFLIRRLTLISKLRHGRINPSHIERPLADRGGVADTGTGRNLEGNHGFLLHHQLSKSCKSGIPAAADRAGNAVQIRAHPAVADTGSLLLRIDGRIVGLIRIAAANQRQQHNDGQCKCKNSLHILSPFLSPIIFLLNKRRCAYSFVKVES